MSECTCGETSFVDSMCKPCLRKAESKLINKIEMYQEKIDDLESSLDQVQYYLEDEICDDCGRSEENCDCDLG